MSSAYVFLLFVGLVERRCLAVVLPHLPGEIFRAITQKYPQYCWEFHDQL